MISSIAAVIAGLGLFWAGMRMLQASLQTVSGRGFRATVSRWTRGALQCVLWGVAAGAVTQSTTTVQFMLIGLVRTGAIAGEVAYPLLVGANLGSSLLVLLTTFRIDLVMLLLLGLSGFATTQERVPLARAAGIVFGAGILYLGLHQIKTGAIPLLDGDSVQAVLAASQGSLLAALVVGAALRLVLQSSVAIVILAATLAAAHALTVPQGVAVVTGVVLGATLSVWLLAARQHGQSRQIVASGMLANLSGASVMLALLFIHGNGPPPIVALLGLTGLSPETQVALSLVLAYVSGLLLVPLRRPLARALARRWPPTVEEGDSVCRYVRDDALADPESAVDLVLMEQRAVISFLSRTVDRARGQENAEALKSAFELRMRQIGDFTDALAATQLSSDAYQRVAALINSHRLLDSLEHTILDLVEEVAQCGPRLGNVTDLVVESIDTVLLTLEATLVEADDYDRHLLRSMTGNRSAALQRIRESFLEREAGLDIESRLHLLTVTSLCERFFWLMGTFLDTPVCQPAMTAPTHA